MSISGTLSITGSSNGVTTIGSVTRTASMGIEPIDTTIPVASALSDWVKTDADTAAGNLTAGHGLSTGTFDVHWTGGYRYGVSCTITTNAVALDGGTGDDFPSSASTDVTMTAVTSFDSTFDGDNLALIHAGASQQTLLRFLDSGSAVLATVFMVAGAGWGWASDTGVANPLTGNAVASVVVSNGSATYTSAFKLSGLQYEV